MELSDFCPGEATVERNRSSAWLCPGGAKSSLIVELVKNLSSPVLLLDSELQVVGQSRAAAFPGIFFSDTRGGRPRLADGVREICLTLKTRGQQVNGGSGRLSEALNGWDGMVIEPQSGASIVMLQEESGRGAQSLFLVQCAAPSEGHSGGLQAELLARLTACERQVAILVAEGCTNDEVAMKLAKSALTVKKQLRSIFQKLHVTTRARLCALVHQSRFTPLGSVDTPNE